MRSIILGLAATSLNIVPLSAEPLNALAGFTMQNEAKLQPRASYWNEEGSDNEGFQIVTPMSGSTVLASDSVLIELGARTAHIYSSNESDGASGRVSALSDTVLSATTTLSHPELPFFPFVTGSINLPTGKETLSGSEKNAVMDRDLVEQTRFGEGWNFNVGAGVTVPITNEISATIAGSYTFREDYVPDGDTGVEYDPGNQTTVYGELQYANPRTLASLGLKYNTESESTLDDESYFRPGRSWELYGQVNRAVTPRDILSASFSAAQYRKNQIFDPFSQSFRVEDEQSAGNTYRLGLSWTRRMSFGTLGLSGDVLVRDRNDYDEVSDRFLPARQRYLFGPNASINLTDAAIFSLSAQYMRLMEDEFPVTGVERSFNGVKASAALSVAF